MVSKIQQIKKEKKEKENRYRSSMRINKKGYGHIIMFLQAEK